jgi:tetratricopeptide (TPR) repeat protein
VELAGDSRVGLLALAGAVAALALAVFWPIREHAFLNYDDDHYIAANPNLARGLDSEGLAWAFTSFDGANWFPLTRLSWMLDAARAGLDPRAFHTTDLVLHAAAAALLFLALARMTRSPWPSAFAAAVFAVHPLHVEAVAWASARKDPLSAVCFGGALLCAAGARGRAPSPAERAGVVVLLALGLMAKPTLVTLPFLLLLLDDWPLGRLRSGADQGPLDRCALRAAALEKAPLFALVAAVSAVVVAAQSAGGAVVPLERIPFGARVANAFASVAVYLRQAIWPAQLAVFYPHPGAELASAAFGFAAALGLSAATALAWRRRPYLLVGWLWFLGMLVPTLGLVQAGAQAHADRYTYLPLTGLAVAVAWGAPDALARLGLGRRARRFALGLASAAAIGALAAASSVQIRSWRDSETLFRSALAATRGNHVAHAHLGAALLEEGRTREAAVEWEAALEIAPDFLEAANNLAWLLATTPDASVRDPVRALAVAERARAIAEPPGAASEGERASVLDTLAAAQAAAGRLAEAVATASDAAALAERSGDPELALALRQRLALYRAGLPFIEP